MLYEVTLQRPSYVALTTDPQVVIQVEASNIQEASVASINKAVNQDTLRFNCINSNFEYEEVQDIPDHKDYSIMNIRQRQFHKDGSSAIYPQIFVFGSNLSGIHGAGAAKAAFRYYSAVYGVGEGHTGRSYALPTVQEQIAGPLPLDDIQVYVDRFLTYARTNPHLDFLVTRVGCGLAGYEDHQIAPMFKDAPVNCSLPENWKQFL